MTLDNLWEPNLIKNINLYNSPAPTTYLFDSECVPNSWFDAFFSLVILKLVIIEEVLRPPISDSLA